MYYKYLAGISPLLKNSPLNKDVWFASIPINFVYFEKKKIPEFLEIQGFNRFAFLKKVVPPEIRHFDLSSCIFLIDIFSKKK